MRVCLHFNLLNLSFTILKVSLDQLLSGQNLINLYIIGWLEDGSSIEEVGKLFTLKLIICHIFLSLLKLFLLDIFLHFFGDVQVSSDRLLLFGAIEEWIELFLKVNFQWLPFLRGFLWICDISFWNVVFNLLFFM
jgi:hypothetical protein